MPLARFEVDSAGQCVDREAGVTLFAGRRLRRFETGAPQCSCDHSCGCSRPVPADIAEADLVCSDFGDGGPMHMPVIDLDVPATLVPSATPGHSHLYINVTVAGPKYWALLKALVEAGIVESGYVGAALERGYTAVRVPWKPKSVTA